MLAPRQYHAVVANPPYITPKDPGLRDRYRKRFVTCHMKYSLAVPFMELLYRLCVPGGFTGQITANSFMKREFGSKLIETFFPGVDLTHVIDTSGAYIPGHGTPTVILFGRQRKPMAPTVRAVMGIRGEPTTPEDPSRGLVWTAITTQVDHPGSQSDFVSVADTPRATFHAHPWSIGGGGAADLKDELEASSDKSLGSVISSIGFASFPGTDDAFVSDSDELRRAGVSGSYVKGFIVGDVVRDWAAVPTEMAFAPYEADFTPIWLDTSARWLKRLWPYRTTIGSVVSFGGRTRLECGSIAFAFVATHNHFVLDRGGKVFKQSAPVIKLPADATEDDHLALLGILNSSTACFWMKQVFHPKGGAGIGRGIHDEKWEERLEFAGTGLESFPLPASRPLDLAREMQRVTAGMAALDPAAVIETFAAGRSVAGVPSSDVADRSPLGSLLGTARVVWGTARRWQIALQEELDWQSYSLYGLVDSPLTYPGSKELPPIDLGERAFEIALARRVAAGDTTTTWFERHGSTPVTEIPAGWPADYRALVQQRLDAIENIQNIRLIEQPEYKRRWSQEPWATRQQEALREFLLARLERLFDFDGRMNDSGEPTASLPMGLVSLGEIATAAGRDPLFVEAAEVLTGDVGFDRLLLVQGLVEAEQVPLLPVLRYKPPGLRKHAEWQAVWELQRREDAIDARTALPAGDPERLTKLEADAEKARTVGDIAVPPKYTSADFLKPSYWSLRGKLDVPKERFVSFPGVTGPDGTALVAWAGLDHLQLAKAIGDTFGLIQTEYGGSDDPRLIPLLANLTELLPWVRQWHPAPLADYGGPPAEFFEQFVKAEAESRGLTWDQVRAWTPAAKARGKTAGKKVLKHTAEQQRKPNSSSDSH
ncbi:MAG: BREX-2 system adenine-specific DNA-methyltransferase PglX [Actinobacteria bacterium]|nr:BREX-2 system adenine-specific DNA-methyltransferase PglX [Actinomycetota bacterium]